MKQTHCNNPTCGKTLKHTKGRRPKKYCTPSCRNAHYKVLYESKGKKKVVFVQDAEGQWKTTDGRVGRFVFD